MPVQSRKKKIEKWQQIAKKLGKKYRMDFAQFEK